MKLMFRLLLPTLLCGLAPACSRPVPPQCTLGVAPAPKGAPEVDFIRLATDSTLAGEAFRLDVRPAGIEIAGGGYGGVFNGIQALFRLLPPEVYSDTCPKRMTLADTTIVDAPRFAYRGMMLDVTRTWIGADALKRYINLLSYHNINKLHLHLSDDEGWRIEIRSHPELTEIGGFRGGDSPVRAVYGKWGEKYGGYFTQDEMRELIAYAAVRNIEIIPEIDLPGHSRNIASVHPEIRCNYPPDTVSTNGYDYRSAWCVAREENYALLEDILGEICALFPSEYINIGGDEVDMEQWRRCPDCRALMRRMGTEDPRRLEDRFMERLTQILAAHGKRPGVWNEAAATGEFTRDCRVYGWSSVKACLDATAKGYPTGRRSATPARSAAGTSPSSDSPKSRCGTSKVFRERSGARSTSRTNPRNPTTSTTCASRASARWRSSPGGAGPTAGSASTANSSPSTTTAWRPWASASGSRRRSSASRTER